MSLYFRKFFDEGDGLTGGEVSENTSGVAEQTTEDDTDDVEVVYTSKDQLDDTNNADEPSENADTANQQSAEENAKYAAMRRKAEAEAEKKFKAMQDQLDRKYAAMFSGYNNPVTGKPIQSAADYAEAFAIQQKQEQEQELRNAGLDPELINRTVQQEIQSSPVMQQAQAVLAQSQQEEANRMIAEDIKNICAIDPTVNDIKDIQSQDNFNDVIAYCQSHNGTRLAEAYKIVNFDRLANIQRQSAQQSAINQAKSKGHLNTVSGLSANTADEIPASEAAKWAEWFPDKTPAERKALYNKTKRKR